MTTPTWRERMNPPGMEMVRSAALELQQHRGQSAQLEEAVAALVQAVALWWSSPIQGSRLTPRASLAWFQSR